jgi:hypothetical protein
MARSFWRIVIMKGVSLCLLLFPVIARGEHPSYLGCPPLPETGPAGQVSVYVAKAQAKPGFVCVRMINGLSEGIGHRVNFARLQKWEEEGWGREAGFREFKDVSTLPDGSVIGELLAHWMLPPGGAHDDYVPHFQPAPPGRYQVCVSYDFPSWQRQQRQKVCSEEFSLP